MPRLSKLLPEAWAEVERRYLQGEPARKLAPEYGVSEAAIRKRFGAHQSAQSAQERVRAAAQALADARQQVQVLPPAQQAAAVSLAESLGQISRNLAAAATYGSATAAQLQRVAHGHVERVGEGLGEDDLRAVHALTKTANEAAATGLNLLRANERELEAARAAQAKQATEVRRIVLVPVVPAPALTMSEKK